MVFGTLGAAAFVTIGFVGAGCALRTVGLAAGLADGLAETGGVDRFGGLVGLVFSPRADCAGSPSAPRVAPDIEPRLLGTTVFTDALALRGFGVAFV